MERKERSSKPRDLVFICSMVLNGNIVTDKVRITMNLDSALSGDIAIKPLPEHIAPNNKGRDKIIASDEDLTKLASDAFIKKYNVDKDLIFVNGPFYERNVKPQTESKSKKTRKYTLKVDGERVDFDKHKVAEAIFSGWHVTARYVSNPAECIENYDPSSGNAVMVMFKKPAGPNAKQAPNKMRFLLEKDLENVVIKN